jgi:hypothetical protein
MKNYLFQTTHNPDNYYKKYKWNLLIYIVDIKILKNFNFLYIL